MVKLEIDLNEENYDKLLKIKELKKLSLNEIISEEIDKLINYIEDQLNSINLTL